ncbi:MAG: hypothetical protein LBG45_03440 [Dysgonamonadaceae bacterium]|jgi:hypothetical protein|nr:hypothetical protein [Dysgonamonadaceae bacterium]
MKKYFVILSALFLYLGTAGCKEENETLPDDTYIELKDLDVETVQNLVQGKWEVISISGGLAGTTEKPADMYIEFIGTTVWCIIRSGSISDRTITKWEKAKDLTFGGGICLTIEGSFPILLVNLYNDTLHFRDMLYDGYNFNAVRVK